jgi:hypothetical protein
LEEQLTKMDEFLLFFLLPKSFVKIIGCNLAALSKDFP